MPKRFAQFVILFAALVAGLWPAYGAVVGHDMMGQVAALEIVLPAAHSAESMEHHASHHHDEQTSRHCDGLFGDCDRHAAPMASGSCNAGASLCGLSVVGTLPLGTASPDRLAFIVSERPPQGGPLTASAIAPDLRPPRIPS